MDKIELIGYDLDTWIFNRNSDNIIYLIGSPTWIRKVWYAPFEYKEYKVARVKYVSDIPNWYWYKND